MATGRFYILPWLRLRDLLVDHHKAAVHRSRYGPGAGGLLYVYN